MITIAGEALIDIVVDQSGSLIARPGGAPFNCARGVARLAGECRFLSRLSNDAFGDRLRATLRDDGVELAPGDSVSLPTTLAIAQVDEHGRVGEPQPQQRQQRLAACDHLRVLAAGGERGYRVIE